MELCQDPQLRSLWPPAAMATTAIHSEEPLCCGTGGSPQGRASASVWFGKQKAENGRRKETSRQEGIRFLPKCVGYSVRSLPLAYPKRQGFSLEANCLVSLRSERRRCFIGSFLLTLSSHFTTLLGLWFSSLSLFFPNVLLYSLNRMYSKRQAHDFRRNGGLYSGFNVCNIII